MMIDDWKKLKKLMIRKMMIDDRFFYVFKSPDRDYPIDH